MMDIDKEFRDEDVEYWYRYEDRTISNGGFDADGEWRSAGPSNIKVSLFDFKVKRHTPKGVWIQCFDNPSGERFVKRDARKRFACPTKKEALESFIARKRRQYGIHKARAEVAVNALRHAEEVLKSCPTSIPETMNVPRSNHLSLESLTTQLL